MTEIKGNYLSGSVKASNMARLKSLRLELPLKQKKRARLSNGEQTLFLNLFFFGLQITIR